jgi:hypothetical protein
VDVISRLIFQLVVLRVVVVVDEMIVIVVDDAIVPIVTGVEAAVVVTRE